MGSSSFVRFASVDLFSFSTFCKVYIIIIRRGPILTLNLSDMYGCTYICMSVFMHECLYSCIQICIRKRI
jgi:hypothetical protein